MNRKLAAIITASVVAIGGIAGVIGQAFAAPRSAYPREVRPYVAHPKGFNDSADVKYGGGKISCPGIDTAKASYGGQSVNVRPELAPLITELMRITQEKHGYPIKSIGGYNCRFVTNGSTPSNHAYARAVDINPAQNPYSPSFKSDMPPGMVADWMKYGFYWGGHYTKKKDAMHFEYIEDRAKIAAFTEAAKKDGRAKPAPTKPAPTPTPTGTPKPTATAKPTRTSTPKPTLTPGGTGTPRVTATATVTPKPTPSGPGMPKPTASLPVATPLLTRSPQPSASASVTTPRATAPPPAESPKVTRTSTPRSTSSPRTTDLPTARPTAPPPAQPTDTGSADEGMAVERSGRDAKTGEESPYPGGLADTGAPDAALPLLLGGIGLIGAGAWAIRRGRR